MLNIGIYVYFGIGILLTIYWWTFKGYQKEYAKARESKEGVEEGMVVLLIMSMICFWPLKLIKDFF